MRGALQERELVCTTDYRMYQAGARVRGPVSEDDLNFYWHGVNDEHPTGYCSNYLTLPKFAFASDTTKEKSGQSQYGFDALERTK